LWLESVSDLVPWMEFSPEAFTRKQLILAGWSLGCVSSQIRKSPHYWHMFWLIQLVILQSLSLVNSELVHLFCFSHYSMASLELGHE